MLSDRKRKPYTSCLQHPSLFSFIALSYSGMLMVLELCFDLFLLLDAWLWFQIRALNWRALISTNSLYSSGVGQANTHPFSSLLLCQFLSVFLQPALNLYKSFSFTLLNKVCIHQHSYCRTLHYISSLIITTMSSFIILLPSLAHLSCFQVSATSYWPCSRYLFPFENEDFWSYLSRVMEIYMISQMWNSSHFSQHDRENALSHFIVASWYEF